MTYTQTNDVKLVQFMADVAKAIRKAADGQPDEGLDYYVSEVRFGFEGEEVVGRVVPDEFGGYGITFDQETT